MRLGKLTSAVLLASALFLLLRAAPALAQKPSTAWFDEARFGMFIHWGLYSAAEGLWKGEPLRYANGYAEWIRYRNRISKTEYGHLAGRFQWDKIDPEAWVLLAKEAGMKYIIITAKHHDGVAIWNSKADDYTLAKLSGSKRDILREIADACKKHGMKLGLYYSHWIDWAHAFGWDHNQELRGRVSDAEYNQYWQEKVLPQLRELLTGYGDIAMMWFDMWMPYQRTIVKKEQLEQAARLIRSLQPECLINSRLGLPPGSEFVDFQTLGDNEFGNAFIDHPWETPGTIAHSWGYNGQERNWKSTTALLYSLISNVSLNGGYTLNIGPRADGSLHYESVSRLRAMGDWLMQYGEAVYGNTGLQLKAALDWGLLTRNTQRNQVYLHVFNWPLDRVLPLSGISSRPVAVELLTPFGPRPLEIQTSGPLMHIRLPEQAPDPRVSVIRLSFDSLELDPDIVPESTFGGFSLNSRNTLNPPEGKIRPFDGLRPLYHELRADTLVWKVYFPEAGSYRADLSAYNPGNIPLPVEVQVAGQHLSAEVPGGTKMVAEPDEEFFIEEFRDQHLGQIEISGAGTYEIRFSIPRQQDVLWFHRLWIKKLEDAEQQ